MHILREAFAIHCIHCRDQILVSSARLKQIAKTGTITCGECGYRADFHQALSAEDKPSAVAEYLHKALDD